MPIRVGMVVRSPEGTVWMLGRHGDAEDRREGALFRNFRMFEATQKFTWQRRGKSIEPVTRLETDTGLETMPAIWGAYEPSPEAYDRQIHTSFETARFITVADVKRDDVVNGMKVSRSDEQLGLRLVTLG